MLQGLHPVDPAEPVGCISTTDDVFLQVSEAAAFVGDDPPRSHFVAQGKSASQENIQTP